MTKKPKISVAIATFNNQESIQDCLKSVAGWVEEIVIIDGGSTDKTVALAQKYTQKIIVTDNPPIFHVNKQKAVDECTGDWILQLDSDEIVSSGLAKEIQMVVAMPSKELRTRKIEGAKMSLFLRHQKILEERDGPIGRSNGEIVAFLIPRKNYFLGRYLLHGGVYPDGVIRLFKKGKAKFPCKSVHEQIAVDGEVAWLENDLIHMADPDFSRYLLRSNRYTSLTAQEYLTKDLSTDIFTTIVYIIFMPLRRFLQLYFRHKGFLDGFPGFVFALYSGLHIAISYVKYWEMKHESRY